MNKPLPFTEYIELAYRRRGELINQTIMLERAMDSFLAKYFCNDTAKETELLEIFLSTTHVTFFAKQEVIMIILKKHIPEFVLAYPDVEKDLKEIMEERNIVAHSVLDFSDVNSNNKNSLIGEVKGVFNAF